MAPPEYVPHMTQHARRTSQIKPDDGCTHTHTRPAIKHHTLTYVHTRHDTYTISTSCSQNIHTKHDAGFLFIHTHINHTPERAHQHRHVHFFLCMIWSCVCMSVYMSFCVCLFVYICVCVCVFGYSTQCIHIQTNGGLWTFVLRSSNP